MKECKNCGYENENSARKCEYCGEKLKKKHGCFTFFIVFLCVISVAGAAAFVYYGGYEKTAEKEKVYVVDSGYFGRDENGNKETLMWCFYSDNTLVISGNGEMGGFEKRGMCYWKNYLERIRKVVISSGVENVGENVFNGCELNCLEIGRDVKRIDAMAFANCVNLKEVVLPEKLEKIGDGAFMGCTSLVRVCTLGDGYELSENSFLNCGKNFEIVRVYEN